MGTGTQLPAIWLPLAAQNLHNCGSIWESMNKFRDLLGLPRGNHGHLNLRSARFRLSSLCLQLLKGGEPMSSETPSLTLMSGQNGTVLEQPLAARGFAGI